MDVSKHPLLKGDARRQLEKYGRNVEFDNYPIVWYTGDCSGTLCGPCAAEELREYIENHAEVDYGCWYEGELPEHCDALHEGPATFCDECNREIFEGLEECERCGAWEATADLTFTPSEALCEKCKS